MKYFYVKLTDEGKMGQLLFWEAPGEPDQATIDALKLIEQESYGQHLGWQTTLQTMGEQGFDLVTVVPQKHKRPNGDVIWNSYIFRRAESDGDKK